MSGRPGRFSPVAFLTLIMLLVSAGSSSAQSGSVAALTSPDVTRFPHLSAYLDVHDTQGGFIHDLKPQDVSLQEDGVSVPVTALDELTPGVQFVIAITPGETFSIRDGMGISRYEYFLQGLLSSAWATQPASQPVGVDDFSLLTLGGPQLTHTSDPSEVRSMLESYTPAGQSSSPSLETLASAMQVASDPSPRPGMERAVLFITPPQPDGVSLGLQSIIANANRQGIHVYVWMLASPDVLESPDVDQMRSLADQTRGVFWGFSHDEAIPDLQNMLEPLRHIYKLGYDSQITTPGGHKVIAQVALGSETISSQEQAFDVDLQPPSVSLINMPLEIARMFPNQPTPETGGLNAELIPPDQVIRLKLAFPDGYDRSIVRTRLYVDGAVMAENSAPPFDQLVWDIRRYTQDGTHNIMVEATDNLGLVGKTAAAMVKITVPSTSQGMLAVISHKQPLFLGAAVVVTGSILVLVLILGGQIRPKPHPGQRRPVKRGGRGNLIPVMRRAAAYPGEAVGEIRASNGISSGQSSAVPKKWWARLPWFKSKETPILARAYLTPLAGYDEPTLPGALQIFSEDVTLGSDAHESSLVIIDASVDGLHARIHHDGKSFMITDAGTVAGTWVNYEEVPPGGTALAHMDIIHLGAIAIRFQQSDPGPLRKVLVTPLEPRQSS